MVFSKICLGIIQQVAQTKVTMEREMHFGIIEHQQQTTVVIHNRKSMLLNKLKIQLFLAEGKRLVK